MYLSGWGWGIFYIGTLTNCCFVLYLLVCGGLTCLPDDGYELLVTERKGNITNGSGN